MCQSSGLQKCQSSGLQKGLSLGNLCNPKRGLTPNPVDDIRPGQEPQITWECISGGVSLWVSLLCQPAVPCGHWCHWDQSCWGQGTVQEQLLAMSPFPTAQTFHGIVPLVLAQAGGSVQPGSAQAGREDGLGSWGCWDGLGGLGADPAPSPSPWALQPGQLSSSSVGQRFGNFGKGVPALSLQEGSSRDLPSPLICYRRQPALGGAAGSAAWDPGSLPNSCP